MHFSEKEKNKRTPPKTPNKLTNQQTANELDLQVSVCSYG